jgi:hypothetical protein
LLIYLCMRLFIYLFNSLINSVFKFQVEGIMHRSISDPSPGDYSELEKHSEPIFAPFYGQGVVSEVIGLTFSTLDAKCDGRQLVRPATPGGAPEDSKTEEIVLDAVKNYLVQLGLKMASKKGLSEFQTERNKFNVSDLEVTSASDEMDCPIACWTTIFEGTNMLLRLGLVPKRTCLPLTQSIQ